MSSNLFVKNLEKIRVGWNTEAIDWSKILRENNHSPEKFDTKRLATGFAQKRCLVFDTIELVSFESDEAWIIFSENNFFNNEGFYSECKDRALCWRKTISWSDGKETNDFFWDKHTAIGKVPQDHPTADSMSVHSPNGSNVFSRKFPNNIEVKSYING